MQGYEFGLRTERQTFEQRPDRCTGPFGPLKWDQHPCEGGRHDRVCGHDEERLTYPACDLACHRAGSATVGRVVRADNDQTHIMRRGPHDLRYGIAVYDPQTDLLTE